MNELIVSVEDDRVRLQWPPGPAVSFALVPGTLRQMLSPLERDAAVRVLTLKMRSFLAPSDLDKARRRPGWVVLCAPLPCHSEALRAVCEAFELPPEAVTRVSAPLAMATVLARGGVTWCLELSTDFLHFTSCCQAGIELVVHVGSSALRASSDPDASATFARLLEEVGGRAPVPVVTLVSGEDDPALLDALRRLGANPSQVPRPDRIEGAIKWLNLRRASAASPRAVPPPAARPAAHPLTRSWDTTRTASAGWAAPGPERAVPPDASSPAPPPPPAGWLVFVGGLTWAASIAALWLLDSKVLLLWNAWMFGHAVEFLGFPRLKEVAWVALFLAILGLPGADLRPAIPVLALGLALVAGTRGHPSLA